MTTDQEVNEMNSKLKLALNDVVLYSKGELKLEKTRVVPPSVDVKGIREELNLSQREFAQSYGFSIAAIRNWEQGVRQPEGPARVLLSLIQNDPERIRSEIENVLVSN